MKFPNPFEAFNKTKEGFTENMEDAIEISGNLLTASSTKKSDDNVSLAIFTVSILWLALTSFTLNITTLSTYVKNNPLAKLSTYAFISYWFVIFMTFSLHQMVYKNYNANITGKLFSVVTSIFLCIFGPLLLLMYFNNSTHFIDIFGNSIGYNVLSSNFLLVPLKFIIFYSIEPNLDCINNNFRSIAFKNSNLDLTPIINWFSISKENLDVNDEIFDKSFDDFMEKAVVPENGRTSKATWNLDFMYKDDKINKLENQLEEQFNSKSADIINRIKGDGWGWDADVYNIHNYNIYKEDIQDIQVLKDTKAEIRKAAVEKFKVGEFTWLYIASLIATIASMNEISL
jgi:hypothetical protein